MRRKVETLSIDELRKLPIFPPDEAKDFTEGRRFLFFPFSPNTGLTVEKGFSACEKRGEFLVADVIGETKSSRTIKIKVVKVVKLEKKDGQT